jgi:hypothetical protein
MKMEPSEMSSALENGPNSSPPCKNTGRMQSSMNQRNRPVLDPISADALILDFLASHNYENCKGMVSKSPSLWHFCYSSPDGLGHFFRILLCTHHISG